MNTTEIFNKLLLENNEKKIKRYIIANGKKPKIICPICKYDKEYLNNLKETNSGK